MDNSRRNIIIVIASLIVICICLVMVGLGAFGYFFPVERITSLLSTEVPAVEEPAVKITEPAQPTEEPEPTEQVIQPAQTTEAVEVEETATPTEEPTLAPIPPEISSQMDEIESQVITLRNLPPAGTVTRRLLNRDELRQMIEVDFFEDYSNEEAREDAIVLAALGLLEPGFDMFNFYQDLLSEQVAGQYNHETKEMDVIQGTGFGGTERLTYAHEYTHALQDQNYDIENGLNYSSEACEEDSERCAAIQALLEGDASTLELDWFYNYATSQDLTDIQNFYQDYESPVYDSAPAFLQEDFLFPYVYGQAFVEYLYNIGGWDAVNAAYSNLPVSTEQILHPERYPDDVPNNPEYPDLLPVLGDQWRELDSGVMGEWYTYLILAHGRDPDGRLDETEAQIASDGWDGDIYIVYYNEDEEAVLVIMHSDWESSNDARQFFDSFRKHSTARFGSPLTSDSNHTSWSHAEGITEIHLEDELTTWIFAPDEGTALLVKSIMTQ
jgi:hypothetical protein